jgi:hypothetical protein
MAFKKQLTASLLTGGLLLGTAACAADGADARSGPGVERQSDPVVDTTIFERAGGEANTIVYDSPDEMAQDSAVVASGTVVGFSDGEEVLEHGSESEGYDIRDYSVVMDVEVTQLYKGSKSVAGSGHVYLTMSRGAEQEGIPDDGGPSTVTPVADFEKAVPRGSQVVVMANPMVMPQAGPMIDVIGSQRGVPNGNTLFSGWHPQAMTFATGDSGTNSWSGRSLAEVRQGLNAQF